MRIFEIAIGEKRWKKKEQAKDRHFSTEEG